MKLKRSRNYRRGRIEIIPMRGPLERGGAVFQGRIHVHMLGQQRADGFSVLLFGRFGEPRIGS